MKCGYPVRLIQSQVERYVPCGQCMPCRINAKRVHTGRILLETMAYDTPSVFATLTYSPESIPARGSLDPRQAMRFIDRLRHRKELKSLGTLRYFLVGEYGSKTWRPHYHCALFGVPPEYAQVIDDCWKEKGRKLGHTDVGIIELESAAYLADYTTKRLTSPRDPRIIDTGLVPEFSRMSKTPPVGTTGIYKIIDMLTTKEGALVLSQQGDIPHVFSSHGRNWPIGKYHKKLLRKELGITTPPEYNPWTIDPEGWEKERISASKKADKAYRQKNQFKNRTL